MRKRELIGDYSICTLTQADGTKLVAVEQVDSSTFFGWIWRSTDSGVTWLKQEGAKRGYWTGVTSSEDGVMLVSLQGTDDKRKPGEWGLNGYQAARVV